MEGEEGIDKGGRRGWGLIVAVEEVSERKGRGYGHEIIKHG